MAWCKFFERWSSACRKLEGLARYVLQSTALPVPCRSSAAGPAEATARYWQASSRSFSGQKTSQGGHTYPKVFRFLYATPNANAAFEASEQNHKRQQSRVQHDGLLEATRHHDGETEATNSLQSCWKSHVCVVSCGFMHVFERFHCICIAARIWLLDAQFKLAARQSLDISRCEDGLVWPAAFVAFWVNP